MELMDQQLMLKKMDGKVIILLISVLFLNCEKKTDQHVKRNVLKKQEAKEFILENINILIDSVESFDMGKYSKFKNLKIEKFKISLADSIITEKNSFGAFLNFTLDKKMIANYKSDYEIKLVQNYNEDIKYLFVQFSNFQLEDNAAEISVRKKIGISMVKDRYYFERKNNKWVLKKKKLLSIG